MEFYLAGRSEGGSFDDGIEAALQRILADPEFVYRGETRAGRRWRPARAIASAISALASRLSFFLWSSIPDDELIDLAAQGKLKDPAVLEKQVRRMLADPKSEALIANFTGQWLNVRVAEDQRAGREPVPGFRRQPARRRSSARPSCSSTASCTRTAASSIC